MKLLAPLFIAGAIAADFFDKYSYDDDDACYAEFFQQIDKSRWAECCANRLFMEGDNCDDKYYPNDVCYPYIEVGWNGVDAGHNDQYPNTEWKNCCDKHCSSGIKCLSPYCRDWADDLENALQSWVIVIIAVAGVIFCGGGLVFALCCLGFCACGSFGKRKAEKRQMKRNGAGARQVQYDAHQAPQFQQHPPPQHYQPQQHHQSPIQVEMTSSSSSSENIVIVKHEVRHI